MIIKDLDNPDIVMERGRQSILFSERKKRLTTLNEQCNRYVNRLANEDNDPEIKDKIYQLFTEVEEINRMIKPEKCGIEAKYFKQKKQ